MVGSKDGYMVGTRVGFLVGIDEGFDENINVGRTDGFADGVGDGSLVGPLLGVGLLPGHEAYVKTSSKVFPEKPSFVTSISVTDESDSSLTSTL